MTHKNLEIWKESIKLVTEIYKITQSFPKEELYGLVSQIRRSAVSIPSNISEGCARQTAKETAQFLYIALGSVAELETQLIISRELNYTKNLDEIFDKINLVKKLIVGFIKFYNSKK
ncbi:MAG: four helix bundle protein [Candidatus Gastranaerophilaceae bacterium]